ncbi:MAG: hypothetical protein IKX70_00190 [Treponema sp.]|nr:hypothetical protein [Treponema sp.]
MKKSVLHFFKVLIAGLVLLCLSSCTGLIQKTGSVSFEIGPELLNAAREGGTPVTEDNREFVRIVVALEGNRYGIKQTVDIPFETYMSSMNSDRRFEATFDNIPVGKKLYAVIKTYQMMPGNNLPLELRDPELYGKSDSFTVKAGLNKVSMNASNYRNLVPFAYNNTPVVTYNSVDEGYSYAINGFSQFTATTDNFCFDKEGNVYVANSKNPASSYSQYEIKSSKFSSPVTVEESYEFAPSIVVDMKTNIMYVYSTNVQSLYLYQYPNLISNESISNSKYWSLNCEQVVYEDNAGTIYEVSPVPRLCAIYDGTLYLLAEDTSSNNCGSFLYKITLGTEGTTENYQIPGGVHIDLPYGSATDMVYLDGCLYITGEEVDTSYDMLKSYLASRGFVCKYDIGNNTCSLVGVSTDKRANTSMNADVGFAFYKDSFQVFMNSARNIPFLISGNLYVNNRAFNQNFPSIYTPAPVNKTLSTTALYGASKIIAIKPKKLVIAEEGIAYYTENDQLFYKNVNRIVTIDLETFAMTFDSVTDTFGEDKQSPFSISITNKINSAFWNATVGGDTTLYPGSSGSEFTGNDDNLSGPWSMKIPCKEN